MNNRRRAILTNNAESDFIIMTSATNPKILKVLYDAGLCASATKMYKSEAEAVHNEDLSVSTAYNGSLFYKNGGTISEDFSAFQYFTGVTALPSYCFCFCRLTNIILPETIETVGYRSLAGNDYTYIEMPESFREFLSSQVFSANNSATPISIYLKSNIPPTVIEREGWFAFGYYAATDAIYVPDNAVDTYKEAWANLKFNQGGANSGDEWLAKIKPISEYQPN